MGYNMLSSNIFLTWLEPASLWGYFCNEFFVLNLTAAVLGVGWGLLLVSKIFNTTWASKTDSRLWNLLVPERPLAIKFKGQGLSIGGQYMYKRSLHLWHLNFSCGIHLTLQPYQRFALLLLQKINHFIEILKCQSSQTSSSYQKLKEL